MSNLLERLERKSASTLNLEAAAALRMMWKFIDGQAGMMLDIDEYIIDGSLPQRPVFDRREIHDD